MTDTQAASSIKALPLTIGLGLMFGLTAYPRAVIDAAGHADHLAATLLAWAMTAGIVRGVGFVPRNVVARWLLSSPACWLALAAGVLRCLLTRA